MDDGKQKFLAVASAMPEYEQWSPQEIEANIRGILHGKDVARQEKLLKSMGQFYDTDWTGDEIRADLTAIFPISEKPLVYAPSYEPDERVLLKKSAQAALGDIDREINGLMSAGKWDQQSEQSLGEKRRLLADVAKGEFDDYEPPGPVENILQGALRNASAVGYLGGPALGFALTQAVGYESKTDKVMRMLELAQEDKRFTDVVGRFKTRTPGAVEAIAKGVAEIAPLLPSFRAAGKFVGETSPRVLAAIPKTQPGGIVLTGKEAARAFAHNIITAVPRGGAVFGTQAILTGTGGEELAKAPVTGAAFETVGTVTEAVMNALPPKYRAARYAGQVVKAMLDGTAFAGGTAAAAAVMGEDQVNLPEEFGKGFLLSISRAAGAEVARRIGEKPPEVRTKAEETILENAKRLMAAKTDQEVVPEVVPPEGPPIDKAKLLEGFRIVVQQMGADAQAKLDEFARREAEEKAKAQSDRASQIEGERKAAYWREKWAKQAPVSQTVENVPQEPESADQIRDELLAVGLPDTKIAAMTEDELRREWRRIARVPEPKAPQGVAAPAQAPIVAEEPKPPEIEPKAVEEPAPQPPIAPVTALAVPPARETTPGTPIAPQKPVGANLEGISNAADGFLQKNYGTSYLPKLTSDQLRTISSELGSSLLKLADADPRTAILERAVEKVDEELKRRGPVEAQPAAPPTPTEANLGPVEETGPEVPTGEVNTALLAQRLAGSFADVRSIEEELRRTNLALQGKELKDSKRKELEEYHNALLDRYGEFMAPVYDVAEVAAKEAEFAKRIAEIRRRRADAEAIIDKQKGKPLKTDKARAAWMEATSASKKANDELDEALDERSRYYMENEVVKMPDGSVVPRDEGLKKWLTQQPAPAPPIAPETPLAVPPARETTPSAPIASQAEVEPERLSALELKAEEIPEDLEIETTVIRERTGKEAKVKQNARQAFTDVVERTNRYKALLDCLKS